MPVKQLDARRDRLCVAGRSVEPIVPVRTLLAALEHEDIERFRPLLPVGYREVAAAYARAAATISADDLSDHYTRGLEFFHESFAPALKRRLEQLTGGAWQFDDFTAFAGAGDVDLMTHLIEAVAAGEPVHVFPGDWFGFVVGSTHQHNIRWDARGDASLACVCVPSVRNGHFTEEMAAFVERAPASLLNLNLFPTLPDEERTAIAERLWPMLPRAVLSISFSRGFGMTASQLGVLLVHRDHPFRRRFSQQLEWFTYFHNALAARTFLEIDLESLTAVDAARRTWVHRWLEDHALPVVATGSYYVKSFQADAPIPPRLEPLVRDGLLRLCFKPPQV